MRLAGVGRSSLRSAWAGPIAVVCAGLSANCGGNGVGAASPSPDSSAESGNSNADSGLDATTGGGCVPGTSIACVGPLGCTGFQVCATSGAGFDPCDCAPPDSGPGPSDTGADGAGVDSAMDSGLPPRDSGSGMNDSGSDAPVSGPAVLRGAVQKGPFVLGSSVTVSTVDSSGSPTGLVYNTQTTDDLGSFGITFAYRGYVDLQAQGYFYDEVTGALSASPIVLRALYDVTNGGQQNAYVNIVTHLAHARALALMGDGGTTLEAAEAQAESELVTALGIGGTGFSPGGVGIQLNEVGANSDANAYLFALSSVLVQAAREQAGEAGSVDGILQELVNTIAADLTSTGQVPAEIVAELRIAERDLDVDLTMDLFHYRLQAVGSTLTPADLNRAIDSDGDGYRNSIDTCPLVANPVQSQIPAGAQCKATRRTTFIPASWGAGIRNVQWGLALGDFRKTGHVGVADFDGVLSDGGYSEAIGLLDGDGSGRFSSPTLTSFPPLYGRALGADVNVDGNLDLATYEAWYPGDGAGQFGSPVPFPRTSFDGGLPPPCSGMAGLVLADFNGDTLLDVAQLLDNAGCVSSSMLQVSLGTAKGVFGAPKLIPLTGTASTYPLSLNAGYIDGDTILDLVVVSQDPSTAAGSVLAMLGDGSGGFQPATATSYVSFNNAYNIFGALLGDFDGDGHLDVAAWSQGSVEVAFGDGTGNFGAVATTTINNPEGFPLFAGDFNGDGKADLTGLLGQAPNLDVLLSAGRTFGAPQALRSGPIYFLGQFTSMAEADVNGDGTPDLVVIGPGSNSSGNWTSQAFLMNYTQ